MMMVSFETWPLKNETCRSSVEPDLMLHYSLLPSAVIIVLLSCLEKRVRRCPVDEKCPLLNRRGGVVIPLDFVGAFSNRWSLGFAFGATANKVMVMFSKEYIPMHVPQWAKAFVLLLGAIEVGLSSYPFFACLSTRFQMTGAILGFLYTGTWFVVMVMYIAQCPHGQVIGAYENVIFYWPPLLCLVFLLGKFVYIFVKALRVRLRQELPNEKTSFLEVHQAQYVQQLMKKPPLQQPQKSWIQRNIYEWDPHFRFPTRMISTAVLAIICLYIFVVIEFYVYKLVSRMLKTLVKNFEMLVASGNATEATASSVQHLNEFIDNTEGVWIFTTYTACLICISYVFHILACYRKHMKRLWAGTKQFLPLVRGKLSSSQSVAAIARYSGWQIAYILWGYLVIHTVQYLFGMMFMYSFILPIKWGQGVEVATHLGTGILALGIVIGLMLLQIVMAASFFLQPKILQTDKEKPLALDNRKVFHNFNYFLFFYNVLLGLSSCLFRLLCSVVVGAWLIARIDRTIMPKGYEAADMGFRTWIGMLFMDHYHTNPTLVCFCHILVTKNQERQQQRTTSNQHFNNIAVHTMASENEDLLTLAAAASKEEEQQTLVSRVASLSCAACEMVSTTYTSIKENLPVIKSICDVAETGVKTIASAAVSGAQPLLGMSQTDEQAIQTLDQEEKQQIFQEPTDEIEEKQPILQELADQAAAAIGELASSTQILPTEGVCQIVVGIEDAGSDLVGLVKEAVQESTEVTKSTASSGMNSGVGQVVAESGDAVIEKSEAMMDHYLPMTDEELATLAASLEEPEVVPIEKQRQQQSYYVRLGSLSTEICQKAYRHALRKLQETKQKAHETLSQLQQAIDVIEYAKQNVDQEVHDGQEKLQQMWLKWGQSQSEQAENSGMSQTEMESRALGMSQTITQQLQALCQIVLADMQGLPATLREMMQQAHGNLEELQTTLSTAKSFQDLSSGFLTQSREKMGKTWEAVDEVVAYVMQNTPLTWVVGPFSPGGTSTETMAEPAAADPEPAKETERQEA